MKKKIFGLVILAAMVVFACAGCGGAPGAGGPDADGQSSAKPEVSAAVNDDAPDTSDPASTDSVLKFSQCEVIGFQVDYETMIDGMDAREVVNIPTGSIQINGLGIGEATQKQFAEEFGEPTFKDPTDGTYRNGNETYDPSDTETLFVRYDENAVMSSFHYYLLPSAYLK